MDLCLVVLNTTPPYFENSQYLLTIFTYSVHNKHGSDCVNVLLLVKVLPAGGLHQ